jgi:hypothetical protein
MGLVITAGIAKLPLKNSCRIPILIIMMKPDQFNHAIISDFFCRIHLYNDMAWNYNMRNGNSAPSKLYRRITSPVFTLTGQATGRTHQSKEGD